MKGNEIMAEEISKTKQKEIDKAEFDKLYQYVKTEILCYDSNQSLPRELVLRLKGLRTGKLIENKNVSDKAEYPYSIILIAFKICRPQILAGLAHNTFTDENHKYNYICKIVDSNLNDVYMRVQNAKKSEEKIINMDIGIFEHEGSEYKQKTKPMTNPRLKNLW